MTNTVSKIVTDETLDSIIQIESSGNPRAKATTSSALGLGQFLNATWLGVVRAHAPELLRGRTESQVLALRTDPSLSIEMLARFTEDNIRTMGGGSPGDIYLAHFLGAGTARKVFRAAPSDKIEPIVGPAAVRANRSILAGKTVKQVRDWASSKMAKAGGHGWVKKYYRASSFVAPRQLVMLDQDLSLPENFRGDTQILELQRQLRTMNYYTGLDDGLWGSKTAGAISGFLNDRHNTSIPAPTSVEMYKSYASAIAAAVSEAEAETPPFRRPVTVARENVDPKTVAAIAPEVVPTKQNFLASAWAAIGGFLLTVWQIFGSYVSSAWDFFTQNKDSIPSAATDPSFLQKVFNYVPPGVWFLAGTLFVSFIAYNAWKARKKIETDVQEGSR